MLSKNNTSGYKGVSYDKSAKKWRAYIGFNKSKIRLGYFSDIEEAKRSRDIAESIYRGDFFNIVEYTKKLYHKETESLWVDAMGEYLKGNFGESFLIFATRYIKNNEPREEYPRQMLNLFASFPSPQFIEWTRGTKSLSQIAKENQTTFYTTRKLFQEYYDFILSNKSNFDK